MSRIVFAILALVFALLAACDQVPQAATPEHANLAPAVTATDAANRGHDAPQPYAYPAPVSGRIDEINVGTFDLVDGIAYPAANESGTVVYVVSKSIASPVLKNSRCLRLHADALALLRDAGFAEVTLDRDGLSPYFGYGKLVGGSSRDLSPGGTQWSSSVSRSAESIKGSVEHNSYGSFEFELTLLRDTAGSEGEIPEPLLLGTYDKIRAAVAARDLAGVLRPQGFDAEQIAAIAGLPGIEQDLNAFGERFLSPGDPAPDTLYPGGFYVDGNSPSGKHFWNSYGFTRCGEFLVLTMISETVL